MEVLTLRVTVTGEKPGYVAVTLRVYSPLSSSLALSMTR